MRKRSIITKKRLAGVVATIAAVGIAVGGTFAWSDLTQNRTNRMAADQTTNVTLNDSFTPPENWTPSSPAVSKKVSVTNNASSAEAVFVRVRFKEYMETTSTEVLEDTDGNPYLFATHNTGEYIGQYVTDDNAPADFEETYNYETMDIDGVTYYLTSFAELRDGIYGKPMYIPSDAGVTVFGTAAKAPYDNLVENLSDPDVQAAEALYNVYDWVPANSIKETATNTTRAEYIKWNLGDDVVPMNIFVNPDQINGQLSNVWVLDSDGWAYWAIPLFKDSTTDNIMESVSLLQMPGDAFEYYIHVEMEAISPGDDPGFGTVANGDLTQNAQDLMDKMMAYVNEANDDGSINMGDTDDTYIDQGVMGQVYLDADSNPAMRYIIVGLDGKVGTGDDGLLVNPSGDTILRGKTATIVDVGGGTMVATVELSDNFSLYPGVDGKIGTYDDVIQEFGTYNSIPLSWYMLDMNNGVATLMSTRVLDTVAYGYTGLSEILLGGPKNWPDSGLHEWLVGDDFKNAFTTEEKTFIAPTDSPISTANINVLNLIQLSLLSGQTATTGDFATALHPAEVLDYLLDESIGGYRVPFPMLGDNSVDPTDVAWMTRATGSILGLNLGPLDIINLGSGVYMVDPSVMETGGIQTGSVSAERGVLPTITVSMHTPVNYPWDA